jgi:hypothetical protein
VKRNVSIVDFVTDPQLLGLSISQPQETLLRSIYGLPLSGSRQDIWQQCTGRETYPRHGFSEATIICGARSGKDSRIATPIGAFEASVSFFSASRCFRNRLITCRIILLSIRFGEQDTTGSERYCTGGEYNAILALFDHPIRSRQYIRRNRQADLLGGFKINDQLELLRLLHGEVGGFSAF